MASGSTKPEAGIFTGLQQVEFRITGTTGLCWGRRSTEVRRPDEQADAFDERAVMTRVRCDDDGHCAISAEGVKRAILTGSTRLNMKVPGAGKSTFKARIQAALILQSDSFTVYKNGHPVTLDDLVIEALDVPSDGKKGGTSRVIRRFPKLQGNWEADCRYLLADEAITRQVLLAHIRAAGVFDGIGTFRPGTGHCHGMFSLATDVDGNPILSLTPITV